MLHLASTTDPKWAPRVLQHLDELLVDHAHCEKKAAGMAINLLFRYPRQTFLMQPLSRLAREELSHFEEVLGPLQDAIAEYSQWRYGVANEKELLKNASGLATAKVDDFILEGPLIGP